MSLEALLNTALTVQCPRVFPDVAPVSEPTPYVVWQQIGGPSQSYVEGALPDKTAAYIQITVWATTRLEANALMRTIEAALVANTTFQATPSGGLIGAYDDADELRGCHQDYEIWAPR